MTIYFRKKPFSPAEPWAFQQTQVFKAFEGLGTRVDLEEGHRAGLHPHVTAAMLAGMRKLAVVSLLLCFSTLSGWADDAIKGSFVGDWSGSSGGSGTFRLLVEPADGKPKCTVSFTFAGEEVKTNVTLCKTEATRLDAQYDFEMGGTHLQSTIHGELQENTLKGDYQTKSLADGSDVDAGNWKAEHQ